MDIRRISSGSSFEALAGYSRAVVVQHPGCREVLVSGCTGFDYGSMSIAAGVEAQTRQAFANVAAALAQAGAGWSIWCVSGSIWPTGRTSRRSRRSSASNAGSLRPRTPRSSAA